MTLLCIDECLDNWLRELGIIRGYSNRNGSSQLSSDLLKCHFYKVLQPTYSCSQTRRVQTWPWLSIINWFSDFICVPVRKHHHSVKKVVGNMSSKHKRQRERGSDSHCWQKPEENTAAKSALSLTQRQRTVSDRGFVLGVAVCLWGSIGLDSRSLGLWSRKRPRQEVRASLNSLEMLYHHYQQGTVSHQGHKSFLGPCACVCDRALFRDSPLQIH